MKILYVVFISLLCTATIQAQAVKGSGHVVRKELSVGNYSHLRNQSSANLYLTDSKTATLIIEADDNIIPFIEITNRNGELLIKNKNDSWFNTKNNINVYIPVHALNELENSGSGNLIAQKTIETPSLKLNSSGSGNTTLPLQTENLQLAQNGSGNVSLSGKAGTFTLTLRGSGNLSAQKLATETVEVKLSGSGNAQLQCSSELTVQLTGSGNVSYTGNPTLAKKITGSGEVRQTH